MKNTQKITRTCLLFLLIGWCVSAYANDSVVKAPMNAFPLPEGRQAQLIEATLWVYPAEVCPGDTVYFCVSARKVPGIWERSIVNTSPLSLTPFIGIYEPSVSCTLPTGKKVPLLDYSYVPKHRSPEVAFSKEYEWLLWSREYQRFLNSKTDAPEKVLMAFSREIPLAAGAGLNGEKPFVEIAVEIVAPVGYIGATVVLPIKERSMEEMQIIGEWYTHNMGMPYLTGTKEYIQEMLQRRDPERQMEPLWSYRQLPHYIPYTENVPIRVREVDLETLASPLTRAYNMSDLRLPPEMLPENTEEWRKLEEQFSESTLRDELHFYRSLCEWYEWFNIRSPNAQKKQEEISQWISERPLPQRISFLLRFSAPRRSVHTDILNEIRYHEERLEALRKADKNTLWDQSRHHAWSDWCKETDTILQELVISKDEEP